MKKNHSKIIFVVTAITVGLFYFFIFPYLYDRDFSLITWQLRPRYRWSMRESTMDYLNELRPTKEEVVELLGETLPEFAFHQNTLTYHLRSYGIGLRADFLMVDFKNGQYQRGYLYEID